MQPGARRPFQRARLRYDAAFATELGYCVDRGIPHSKYLEQWSAEDRAKVVALLLERSERCSMCGTSPWEWDPAQGGHKHAYDPEHQICLGCQRKELLRDDTEKAPAGSSVVLVPRKVAAARRRARRAKEAQQ